MTQKPRISLLRIAGLTALVSGVLWLETFGDFRQEMVSAPGRHPLPEFSLPVLNDGLFQGDTTIVRSEDLRGHITLLTFWSSWCQPCLAEHASLLSLQREFQDEGLRVLGVLHQESPRNALAWLKENPRIELETVVGSRAFATANGVIGIPTTLMVDRRGRVAEVFYGFRPDRHWEFRARVMRLLESRPLEESPSATGEAPRT